MGSRIDAKAGRPRPVPVQFGGVNHLCCSLAKSPAFNSPVFSRQAVAYTNEYPQIFVDTLIPF